MGVFGPVIEALMLPMLDPGHDLPLGSGVASSIENSVTGADRVARPKYDQGVDRGSKEISRDLD